MSGPGGAGEGAGLGGDGEGGVGEGGVGEGGVGEGGVGGGDVGHSQFLCPQSQQGIGGLPHKKGVMLLSRIDGIRNIPGQSWPRMQQGPLPQT